MTIVPYPQQPTRLVRTSLIESMDDIFQLAETVANTEFVPRGLRGNQAAIIAAVLYGREIGMEPMQSLAKIAVIDGRPTLAAEAQRALILHEGHEIWFEESTATRAVVCGRRRDGKQTTRVTWTLDDAKRARIAGKPNWQAYPRQMLVARASAELARQVFADVIGGMAATEEFDDVDDVDASPLTGGSTPPEVEPAKRTRRRRPAASAAPPPAEAPIPPPPTIPQPAPEPEPQPEPQPEPPPAGEPEPTPAEPDRPNRAQMNMLFALFAEKGLAERDDRLAYTRRALDRDLQSATELTALDASRLIEALQAEPTAPPRPAPPPAQPTATEQEVLDALQQELGATDVTDAQHGPGDFPDGF